MSRKNVHTHTLTIAFANGIRTVERFVTFHLTVNLATVTNFFPCTSTCRANALAVAVACLVFALEFVHEHFAIATHETVVLVRPLLWLASAVAFEKSSVVVE